MICPIDSCSKPGLAENLKQGLNKLLAIEVPIEIKPVNPPQFSSHAVEEPKKLYWVRTKGYIGKVVFTSLTMVLVMANAVAMFSEFEGNCLALHLSFCTGEGNMKLHCCVAAYVSDFASLATAILPYPNFRVKFSASLDHAMWFHSTFRSDEWMLYECESPWAGQHLHDCFPSNCSPDVFEKTRLHSLFVINVAAVLYLCHGLVSRAPYLRMF